MSDTSAPGFHWASTLWSTVLKAKDLSSEGGQQAMDRLAKLYWKPIYIYVRSKGADAETAKDQTQGFFLYLFEKGLIGRADPGKGSFRAFLRAILDRFLSDEFDRRRALKRGGELRRIHLEYAEAETDIAYGPSAPEDPAKAFERTWVEETLARVLARFKEDSHSKGRPLWYEVFRLRYEPKRGAASYEAIARQLEISEADVTNYIHRGRERFKELLLEELREGVSSAEALDEEVRLFRTIL